MKFVRLATAPAVLSVATFLGDTRSAASDGADLAALTGDSPLRYRRMDRYAALGFATAQLALRGAGVAPAEEADPGWGIALGSSTGCWSSNAAFFHDLRRLPAAELSPAVFARTVPNTGNGEISIAQRIGGPSETFVSGLSAGATAIAEGGAWIDEGKAGFVLAGAVEAPDAAVHEIHSAMRAECRAGWAPESLAQAAGMLLLAREGGPGAQRLRAYARGHDPSGSMSLSAAVGCAGLVDPRVIVCGAIAPALRDRWRKEVPAAEFEAVRADLGAAAIVFALEQAGAAPVLLVAREWHGAVVLLAFGP